MKYLVVHPIFIVLTFMLIESSTHVLCQDKMAVEGVVVDAKSLQAVSYASVFSVNSGKGTVSDMEGFFRLESLLPSDTIGISFLGYKTLKMPVFKALETKQFELSPQMEQMGTAVIMGDNSYLYQLVSNCGRKRHFKTKEGKVYYSLGSYVDDRRVELVESYYNGVFFDFNLQELRLKNGRLGLDVFNNSFFVSSEVSRAITRHKLFDESTLFPMNPLQLSRRSLKKCYDLALRSRYKDEQNNVIFQIAFAPLSNSTSRFSGELWVDSISGSVLKIDMKCTNASVHPFVPVGHMDHMERVDLSITRTFDSVDGSLFQKSMDFRYGIDYVGNDGVRHEVHSEALLYAYDFNSTFFTPLFHFSDGSREDYRRINAIPYNDFFWDVVSDFGMSDKTGENDDFVKNTAVLNSKTAFKSSEFLENGVLEHLYMHWSPDRISIRTTDYNPLEDRDIKELPHRSDLGSTFSSTWMW